MHWPDLKLKPINLWSLPWAGKNLSRYAEELKDYLHTDKEFDEKKRKRQDFNKVQ